MSPIVLFLIAALVVVAAVLVVILPPLLRRPKTSAAADRRDANVAIFRDQLAELEREKLDGSLAEADFAQARTELQRRLLEEVQPETLAVTGAATPTRSGRKTAIIIAVLLPLAALGLYRVLGNPDALDPMQRQARVSPQQIEEMLIRLETKLRKNPEDAKGWVMLARSYKALGRYAESAEAYGRGSKLVDTDATLLADYAEVLGQANNGRLDGKPTELLKRALKIDPDEPQALFLAGAAATDRNDFKAVAEYWGRLLPQLDADSEEGKALKAAVDKARMIAGGKRGTQDSSPSFGRPETVAGEVGIAAKLKAQVKPDDLLFVFARADEGSRMPLAVMRARVGDLPLKFSFDDSMALPGGQQLSEFQTISIEARVAKAGKAQTSSGDLFGVVKHVKPGSKNIKLSIDQIQP